MLPQHSNVLSFEAVPPSNKGKKDDGLSSATISCFEEAQVHKLEAEITALPSVDVELNLERLIVLEQKGTETAMGQQGEVEPTERQLTRPSSLLNHSLLLQGIVNAHRLVVHKTGQADEAARLAMLLQRINALIANLTANGWCKLESDRKAKGFSHSPWFQFKECRKFGIPNKKEYDVSIQAIHDGSFPSYKTYQLAEV
jgi:hypothetical protein